MTSNLPKKGSILEVSSYDQPELPKKAERVYGKPGKGDHTGLYLDRDGKVQTVHYRMPEAKPAKGQTSTTASDEAAEDVSVAKVRPDVTQKGQDMIGDFRTDALHEALAKAPIEDDMLMALLVLAFAGQNVRVDSGAGGALHGGARFGRHAARLFTGDGRFSFDRDTVRIAARAALVDVLSCRRGMSNSGVVSRIAGEAIGADRFLPDMGTEGFLLCLSRPSLEAVAKDAGIPPHARLRETRSALVEHFAGDAILVHPAALFAPDVQDVAALLRHGEDGAERDEGATADVPDDAADIEGPADNEEQVDLDGEAGTVDRQEAPCGVAAE